LACIPDTSTLARQDPIEEHRHPAVQLPALQHPALLETAAALPRSTTLDLYTQRIDNGLRILQALDDQADDEDPGDPTEPVPAPA
jgi:hypothetical protein